MIAGTIIIIAPIVLGLLALEIEELKLKINIDIHQPIC